MCHVCAWCLSRPEEDVRSLGAAVTDDGCELSQGCWESNSGLLEEQPVLATVETSLQPLGVLLFVCLRPNLISYDPPASVSQVRDYKYEPARLVHLCFLKSMPWRRGEKAQPEVTLESWSRQGPGVSAG